MNTTPIVLVPGYWLGAWAWDEVAALLRTDGYEVTALTLPGLESADADRSAVTLPDHVDAICAAVTAAGRPVVLAVHSGSGVPGYAVTDRIPELIAAMVYVDSAPGTGSPDAELIEPDLPLPAWEDLGENLDGISAEQLAEFRRRAVPQPGNAQRAAPALTNDARLDIPSTILCTSYTSDQVKEAVTQGYEWLSGLTELRDVTYVDVPTSHWPMWSRPKEVAALLADVARSVAGH